ncbi:RagB/SusD family nutrient uptake outer membrane protein [Paraflavitalea sp. CAU 1676]|uniref:RagB/SusD family nutrient uptake outer membrane protein n=1 Tax=Paraflavitalea sp. CAU 1676 TaxID=3032598 RepID=UPI0023DB93C6|nr:RagB/SusD family nutrient uptake outer membrane protein [Paraflavitalea sp. CAU 1676]MDF2191145.1 RagB/SusD family nutrient uptake outer membrane protein [Paraflavitalea sp. CAU 1676]
MRKQLLYIVSFASLLLLATACNKDYLDRYPQSGPSSASFYTNEDELTLGLMGCYSQMNYGNSNRLPWHLFMDATSDICWERTNGALQDIAKGSQDVNNAIALLGWKESYQGIGRCNFLLDNIEKLSGKVSDAVLKQTRAEARFIRAFQYHYLIELYGGVPLITKTLELSEAQVAKSTKAQVADFIIKELSEAAADLPLNQAAINNGRATKGAALFYKSRTALYNERWDVAIEAAKAVMDLKKYELHSSFPELFTYAGKSSKEVILSLQFLRGINTHSTPQYLLPRLPGGVCDKVPFQSFVDCYECTDGKQIDKSPLYNPVKPFENRDPRLGYTVGLPGSIIFGYQFETHKDSLKIWNYNTTPATRINNTEATHAFATFTGYVWRKYTDVADGAFRTTSEMPIILARYAEVLLNYAEAKIELNQLDNTVYEAINAVRQRKSVTMPALPTGLTQQELKAAVRRERKYELAMEGTRLFDLRRWKLAETLLKGDFYGRIPKGLLSGAPVVDQYGTPNYSNVANAKDMRVIETKTFKTPRDYLWPIPGIDILANKALEQNKDY